MKKNIFLIICGTILCISFYVGYNFYENGKVEPNKITCKYSNTNPNQSLGISDATEGLSSGNAYVDGFTTLLGVADDLQSSVKSHSFSCSYSKDGIPDKRFINQVNKGLIKYIVFYNGLLKNYYKIYSGSAISDQTLKSSIDYIGLIDKDGNLIYIANVKSGHSEPVTQSGLNQLSKYKYEQ